MMIEDLKVRLEEQTSTNQDDKEVSQTRTAKLQEALREREELLLHRPSNSC